MTKGSEVVEGFWVGNDCDVPGGADDGAGAFRSFDLCVRVSWDPTKLTAGFGELRDATRIHPDTNIPSSCRPRATAGCNSRQPGVCPAVALHLGLFSCYARSAQSAFTCRVSFTFARAQRASIKCCTIRQATPDRLRVRPARLRWIVSDHLRAHSQLEQHGRKGRRPRLLFAQGHRRKRRTRGSRWEPQPPCAGPLPGWLCELLAEPADSRLNPPSWC